MSPQSIKSSASRQTTKQTPKKSQRALANRHREEQAQRIGKLSRSLLLLLATVLSFATIALLVADQLYRPDTFTIDQLKIKGKFSHLMPNEVEQVVLQNEIGNFFSVKLNDIKTQVEAMPWVQSAEVRREWPNTLLIDVTEHRPVMKWHKDQWVNSLGKVVSLPGQTELSSPVVLSGNDKDSELILRQTYQWQKQLRNAGLEIKKVTLSDSHAWHLTLRYANAGDEFDVLLGRDHVEQRLARFLYLFEAQFKQTDKILERVDARYPNGLAIKSVPIEQDEVVAMSQSVTQQLNQLPL